MLRGGTRRSSRSTGSRATRPTATKVTPASTTAGEQRRRPGTASRARTAASPGSSTTRANQDASSASSAPGTTRDQRDREQLAEQQPPGAPAAAAAQPGERDLGPALLGDREQDQPEHDDREQAQLGHQQRDGDPGLVDLVAGRPSARSGQTGDDVQSTGVPRRRVAGAARSVTRRTEGEELVDADGVAVERGSRRSRTYGRSDAGPSNVVAGGDPDVVLQDDGGARSTIDPRASGQGLAEPVVAGTLLVDADDLQRATLGRAVLTGAGHDLDGRADVEPEVVDVGLR